MTGDIEELLLDGLFLSSNQIKRRQGIMGGNRYIEKDIYNKIVLEARELYGRL